MKLNHWLILSMAFLLSCNREKHTAESKDVDGCEQQKYGMFTHHYATYSDWKIAYLNCISLCIDDSNKVIQLAKMDADDGDYSIFVYGMIERTEPFETIHEKYPINFHCPGCVSSDMGEIYNREMKRYLKQNEGLDYDSVYQAENKKFKQNEMR